MKKLNSISVFTLLISLTVTLYVSPVLAQAQPEEVNQSEGKDAVINRMPDINRGTAQTIADALGLGDIFNGVLDFFNGIENINDNTLEAKTPDWNTVRTTIQGTDTRAKELSRQLEDRTSDSFHINQDESEQIQRELIQEAVSASTTSTEAQEISVASLLEIEDALKKSGNLSQDSSGTDVTQQILQNMSEQTGINTQLLGLIASQNVQSQQDRSNQINLSLQQARHNSIESTHRRREASVATDLGISAWGSISTPTFLYEKP